MVETHWDNIKERELRYSDRTWSLTGDVDVRRDGELLAVGAKRVDGVKREAATLYFGLDSPPGSLNPGNLGEHFSSLERDGDGHQLVIKNDRRTYRYVLQRLSYE